MPDPQNLDPLFDAVNDNVGSIRNQQFARTLDPATPASRRHHPCGTYLRIVALGPIGVGKTTAGIEVSTILAQTGVPHTFIDLDALTMSLLSRRVATGGPYRW